MLQAPDVAPDPEALPRGSRVALTRAPGGFWRVDTDHGPERVTIRPDRPGGAGFFSTDARRRELRPEPEASA